MTLSVRFDIDRQKLTVEFAQQSVELAQSSALGNASICPLIVVSCGTAPSPATSV
jgi:hypothetical protein